ncbi:MAG: nucleotidyltransferase family protein [Myxococcota bacterium]|nr:nucleotidyltransferase family protein [Myxococcota bacterium]
MSQPRKSPNTIPPRDVSLRKGTWAGLIPAAGLSSRMGFPKSLLLNEDGIPFAVALSRAFLDAGLAPVIVTIPPSPMSDQLEDALGPLRVQTTLNMAPHKGLSGSIETAIQRIPPQASGIFLCPIDNPFASADLIGGMLGALEQTAPPCQAVVASYGGRSGHPVAFGRSLFPDLLHAGDNGGPRSVLESLGSQVLRYETQTPNTLCNLNTPEAYERTFGKRPGQ